MKETWERMQRKTLRRTLKCIIEIAWCSSLHVRTSSTQSILNYGSYIFQSIKLKLLIWCLHDINFEKVGDDFQIKNRLPSLISKLGNRLS